MKKHGFPGTWFRITFSSGEKLLNFLTHLRLKIAKSFRECVNLGRIAAFPGTLITPTYWDEFLGEISKVMSSKGDPLTLSNSNKSFESSSDVELPWLNSLLWLETVSKKSWLVVLLGNFKNSEKFPWMNSTAEIELIKL